MARPSNAPVARMVQTDMWVGANTTLSQTARESLGTATATETVEVQTTLPVGTQQDKVIDGVGRSVRMISTVIS